jgi:hypothetical protein
MFSCPQQYENGDKGFAHCSGGVRFGGDRHREQVADYAQSKNTSSLSTIPQLIGTTMHIRRRGKRIRVQGLRRVCLPSRFG